MDDTFRRIYALRALAKGGSSTRITDLIRVLTEDPEPVVRHEAAFWLGEVGTSQAVDALIHALQNDNSPLVRHESAEALGWIPTEQSRQALQKALADPDETVRNTARISLDIHANPER
jgi:deoxyhypusine monooxygenase